MTIARKRAAAPADSPQQNGFSLISNDKLLQLYTTMLKCRMTEERIRVLSKRNGPFDLQSAVKQEAAVVGVGLDLLPGDTLAPSPQGHIPCFVKGLPLETIFAKMVSSLAAGTSRARTRYQRLNIIPPSLSLGAQLDRAIAAATANKAAKNKRISVAFCGSCSAARGLLHQSMQQAGKRNLPILLICHSGPYDDEICAQAEDYGFPGVTVDADDAIAVYRVATEAMTHARRGSGPTLVECKPWVLTGHKANGRRSASDPILRMEEYLTRKGLFDRKFKSRIALNFRRELDAASTIA